MGQLEFLATSRVGEVPHPSVYVQEEMWARGWDFLDLVVGMEGDPRIHVLALEMWCAVGPIDARCRLNEEYWNQLARAFGVPVEFLLNLDSAWRNSLSGARREGGA